MLRVVQDARHHLKTFQIMLLGKTDVDCRIQYGENLYLLLSQVSVGAAGIGRVDEAAKAAKAYKNGDNNPAEPQD